MNRLIRFKPKDKFVTVIEIWENYPLSTEINLVLEEELALIGTTSAEALYLLTAEQDFHSSNGYTYRLEFN